MQPVTDKKRLQMADIARLAGVSVSTVSRALNGSTLINEETRTRVAELAKTLNYSINVGAQNLRLGQNRTIGVVIPLDRRIHQQVSDPFFLAMLGSLADALTDRGYDLLLSRIDADHLDNAAAIQASGRVAGLIVIGQWGHHDQLNDMAYRQVPLVVWGAQLPQQLYCSVGGDNVRGGELATAHLLALGRRRLAFVGDTALPEVALRYEGYLRAHQTAGLTPDPALCITSPFTTAGAQQAMRGFLAGPGRVPFDGIVAASDLIAISAMGVLASQGLRVPQDVAVVGYDDVDAAAGSHPPLTTVRQAIDQAGVYLIDCLIDRIERGHSESRLVATSLVVRESCGATQSENP